MSILKSRVKNGVVIWGTALFVLVELVGIAFSFLENKLAERISD